MVIPTVEMQDKMFKWYHHYLQHPGANHVIETCCDVMWWSNIRTHIVKLVKTCNRYQKGKSAKLEYGHLPPKIAIVIPWNQVCANLIGPYTIKAKDGTVMEFMCLTMIDPATS